MKYKLTTNTKVRYGTTLYQIEALKDFGDVKKGDLGGFVQSEKNLSQIGDCWVYDNAMVISDTWVYDNARISNNALVREEAWVGGNARVRDNAEIRGDGWLKGSADISRSTEIRTGVYA